MRGGIVTRVAVVYTTLPDVETATVLVQALLERRLVACGNLLPMRSMFWWDGKVQGAEEVGVLLKVPAASLDAVFAAVRELHPYEVPCIEEWDVDRVHAPYEKWVLTEARGAKAPAARKAAASPKRASAASAKGRGSKGRASRSRKRAA